MALSPIVTSLAAGSHRTRQFPLAAQGTCDRTPAPYFFRRSGRRSPHTNFPFGGDTDDRDGSPVRFTVLSGLTTASGLLAVPATFHRGCPCSDGCVCVG